MDDTFNLLKYLQYLYKWTWLFNILNEALFCSSAAWAIHKFKYTWKSFPCSLLLLVNNTVGLIIFGFHLTYNFCISFHAVQEPPSQVLRVLNYKFQAATSTCLFSKKVVYTQSKLCDFFSRISHYILDSILLCTRLLNSCFEIVYFTSKSQNRSLWLKMGFQDSLGRRKTLEKIRACKTFSVQRRLFTILPYI